MKILPLLLVGASLLGATPPLPAQNNIATAADPFVKNPGDSSAAGADDAGPWKNLMLVLEVYALDKNDGLAVLESERGSAARYRRVMDLAKTSKARLEILTALVTTSGQRATVEAIDEVRYAAEFARPVAEGGLAAPTSFEKRDVGDTLEFEPSFDPDWRLSTISIVPKRVGLHGFRDISAMAGDSPVAYPIFSTQNHTSSATVVPNEPHFLGTLSPARRQGVADGGGASETWLAFIRANVVGPAADELKPPAKRIDWYNLNLEYSIYSLDRNAAREILGAAPDLQAPWKGLQVLLGEKKASFEHLVSVQTKSGQRAMTEELQEVRYAGEYVPGARPTQEEKTTRTSSTRLGGPNPEKKRVPDDHGTTTTETTTVNRVIVNAGVTPGMPAEFERDDAGVSVELEPTVRPDGLSIDIQHVVKMMTHLGDLKAAGLAARYPAQPVFETRRIITNQTLLAGRHVLIGTFNPPGANGVNERTDSGRTWLIFVRVTPSEP